MDDIPRASFDPAGLRYRVVAERGGRPSWVVVLCHGYGAPGSDLVGLAPALKRVSAQIDKEVRFIFPEAPLSLGNFGYGEEARAWWPLDVNRFAAVSQRGSDEGLRLLRHELPVELEAARRTLIALVEEVARDAGVPLSRMVLGGFSQGAMLATDVALRLREAPAALVAFSGTLIAEAEWRAQAPSRLGLPTLLTHGREDPILPYANAVALRDLLQEAGWDVRFVPFPGGHAIPVEALRGCAELLARLIGV